MVCDGWPNSHFVSGRMGRTSPGHAKHAGNEDGQGQFTKEKKDCTKETAGKETQYGKHARDEYARHEDVQYPQ